MAIPFSKHHFFQTDNQKAVLFTVFLLLELFFSCCIVVVLLKENLLKTLAIVLLTNFQHIQMLQHLRLTFDWLSVSFFDYWPIRMSGLFLFRTELTSSALNYLKTAIILTNQNWVIFSCILLISVQHFCHAKRILSQSVPWNAQIKIIQFFLWLFKYETSDTTNG